MSETMQAPVVWSEIPVTDLTRAMAFYEAVTGHPLTRQQMGPNETAVFGAGFAGAGGGHLYEGKPATAGNGPTLHLACTGTLEEAMARCGEAGGTVVSPAIEIPAGRFAYAIDPDGNSVGLFQAS